MAIGVRWRKVRGDLGQYRAIRRSSWRPSPSGCSPWAPRRGPRHSSGATSRRGSPRRDPPPRRCSPAWASIASSWTSSGACRGGRRRGAAERRGPAARGRRHLEGDAAHALPAFEDQRIDLVRRQTGTFPPAEGEVAFERSALRIVDVAAGQTIRIRAPGGKEHDLAVAGLAHEPGRHRPTTSAGSTPT